ncbi:MAG: restriction endonuclease subunit S, partial [Thermotogae bacterium]
MKEKENTNYNNKSNLYPLPKGWIWTKLGEVSDIILGQSPPSSTYNTAGRGLPFYQGKLEFGDIYPSPRKWCTSPKKIAEKDDILISVRAPVGPTNICPERSCIGRGLAAIRGLEGISPLFILYLLRNFEDELAGKGTGTTFQAITGNKLKNFEIPLPPLSEQHRIVAKIEELFTRLDAGVKSLKKAKEQLRWYRQSVLKAAMEGKLTEE